MRQIGTLNSAEDAQRFAAYLITQRMGAVAEQDGSVWAIWIKNEDHLPAAREALDQYRLNPQDPRYKDAAAKAAEMQREEQQRQTAAKKNVVEMRGRWKSGPGSTGSIFRDAPFTCVLIGLSLFVSLTQRFDTRSEAYRMLKLADPTLEDVLTGRFDAFSQVKQGQVWRLVTPIFLHGSLMHLGFNMLMLYSLGRRFEGRYGAWRMALLVLAVAVTSIVGSYWWAHTLGIGMSGVVYGLFGFMWMKSIFDPQPGLTLDPGTVFFALAWLIGCMVAQTPPFDQHLRALQIVDNSIHFIGMSVGMIAATAPLAFKRR